jgi:hypothetical protein
MGGEIRDDQWTLTFVTLTSPGWIPVLNDNQVILLKGLCPAMGTNPSGNNHQRWHSWDRDGANKDW